ncbi:MAG: hypothetical protein FJ214_00990 [Ignavibacteria bacterium]|nr:hypothetical protein [Ignavibacteria bacterium]
METIPQKITMVGKIVGVYVKDGKKYVKILCESGCHDIEVHQTENFHLEAKVTLELISKLTLNVQEFNNN